MRKIFAAIAALLSLTAVGHADPTLIGYWDLNGPNPLDRTLGTSGVLSASLVDVGTGYINVETPGSDLNLEPGSDAGTAIVFGSFVTIVGVGNITIKDIDLTNYSLPTLSFAGAKDVTAAIFSTFVVQYRVGNSGGWTTFADLTELTPDYTVFSAPIQTNVLDGLNNVQLRIHFEEIATFDSYALFDNIKITAEAVPEPSTWALIVLGLASVFYFRQLRAVR